MNAQQIIAEIVSQEMAKHILWMSPRACSCGEWTIGGCRARLTVASIGDEHRNHIAQMIAGRLMVGFKLKDLRL